MLGVSKFIWRSMCAVACLAGLGCDLVGPDTTAFIIRVDSMSALDSIAATDTLTVRFWGKIGGNGCSWLDRVETARSQGLLEITFHGRRRQRGLCTQMPTVLKHDETIRPPMQDPFAIRVMQPDGTTLVKSVRIR